MDKYADLINDIENYYLLSIAKKVWGPYTRRDGRQIIIVKNDDSKVTTISYPKYVMQEHLGHELDENLTVDHIDYNPQNNDISNLRIVPRDVHSADDTKRVKMVKVKCVMCGREFERSPRLLRDKAKKRMNSSLCSKSCVGRYSRMLQLKKIKKLPPQKYIDSEYYRRKIENHKKKKS